MTGKLDLQQICHAGLLTLRAYDGMVMMPSDKEVPSSTYIL